MLKLLIILTITFILSACNPILSNSFTTVSNPGWISIEVRDNVIYDHAWNTLVSILVKDFDIIILAKPEGYIQTEWHYSWSGVYEPNYRVRVKAKFSDDRKKLELKTEAQALIYGTWTIGVDERLVSTVKTDIMGTIGRTTR